MTRFQTLFCSLWKFLREVSGENDYARCRSRALEQGTPVMTPGAFYAERLREKYSRPNRCC
jgi:uncharacterized short protein YbdD (DUF466 family)